MDMFSNTVDIHSGVSKHVETVVMLSHKKPDSVINVKVEFGEGIRSGCVNTTSSVIIILKTKWRSSMRTVAPKLDNNQQVQTPMLNCY